MAEEEEDNSHNGEDDINGDSPVAHSVKMTREGSLLRREEHRRNRMARLHLKRIIETQIIAERMSTARDTPVNVEWSEDGSASFVAEVQKETEQLDQKTNRSHLITQLENLVGNIRPPNHPLEVRLENITYTVKVPALGEDTIGTVLTSSPIYIAMTYLKRLWRGQALNAPTSDQHLLKDINLVFKPGKSYLVLGHPAAGQSWLLRLVAGLLRPHNKSHTLQGSILYNGTTLEEKQFHIENMFAFIDQLDKHAPRFTVQDTFEFANKCKRSIEILEAALNKEMDTDMKEELETAKRDNIFVQLVLIGLGLDGVKDTFVGDADVRGVSGGQRRRVTVGEMMGSLSSILCGDEISNGLDAASTYDMIQVLAYFATFRNFTRLISLLQASPETISLFDEIILMAKGQVIFAGPVHEVEDYFAEIGFICPPFVDIGEFLLMVSSEDNSLVFEDSTGDGSNGTRPSISELAERFRTSILGKNIRADLQSPSKFSWESDNDKIPLQARRKYANNFFVSTGVIFWRFFTLWRRDKRVIMAGTFKNIIMGVSVGGTYLSTRNVQSISGALFQAVLFVVLGAMQSASSLIPDRVIFYKHTDANFYSAWPFVFGRSLSQIPQTFSDTTLFATLLYFMIGLADRDSAANFFVYLSLLFAFAILMNQQLAVFASFADAGALSAYSACIVLILVLFGGFIIPPNTIPNYFQWLYWWNPFAWVYRSLMVNEFRSGRWSDPDTILENAGFMDPSGEPFSAKWIAWGFVYMVPYSMLCCTLTALGLTFVRNTGGGVPAEPKSSIKLELSETDIRLPFKPVTLSFRNISYEVVASTSKETLTLLNDVNGMFKPGRMCCLMGTSGAG
jgi:ABC-type multidrug transport system ATPase subunit